MKKRSPKILAIAPAFGLVLLLGCLVQTDPIVFQSQESKTADEGPVFNRVQLHSSWDSDIWLMQQSHHGINKLYEGWDRLAIVVDKSKRPYQATFHQLAPGNTFPDLSRDSVPLKARCFACHANGPRAIRPQMIGSVNLGMVERVRILFWNLRIKTYGVVQGEASVHSSGDVRFKTQLSEFSEPLALDSCQPCHGKGGIRNSLTMEHLGTARSLVENGHMPPFPFSMSESDRKSFELWTKGI